MRGIVAPIFGLLAVLSIVLGVLNATVWKPNSIVSAHTNVYGSRYIVTDPGVLNLVDYRVKISVAALNTRKPICVAVGLAKDVRGWTRGYSVQRITGLQDWENLSTVPMKADDSAKSDVNNKNSVDSANNSDSKASKDVDFKDSDLWTNATCQMGLAKLFVNAEDFEQSENIVPGDLSSGNAVNQENQANQENSQSNHQKVSSALRARISRRVLIIDLGKNSPEAFVEFRWRRHNLPDFATPLYFVGALFVLLCVLSASVFAMAPHRRRNKRLVASRSGLITVESVSRDEEVKFSDAFAGTMASIFGSFAKDKKSRHKGSSASHARHGAHSKTRVAKSQATVDLSVNVKSGLNSSPTPSLDETAVISKEDLQSYFARFASESVSDVSKDNSDSSTVLEVSDVSSDKSSSDSFKYDDDAIRDSKDSLNDDSNKKQSSKEYSGNSSNNNSRKSSHSNRGNRNSRYGRRNRDSHDNQDDRSSSRYVENRKYRDNRSKSAVAGDSSNEKSNNRSKSRDQGNHRDSNNHRDQRKNGQNGQNGQNNQRGQKYGKNRRSSELDNRNRNSGENNANNRNTSGNTNSNYNQNRRRKNNARGNEQK
ncbi:MAG: hypothetical protein DI615_01595 [Gardnerella vaginalis]|nr:MAG: hypothetical protein DI615_01595 [Gardnerella vaginalis]PZP11550.1 MAG: hypothetical protein DI614_01595 [Gardnerella vaginalis]